MGQCCSHVNATGVGWESLVFFWSNNCHGIMAGPFFFKTYLNTREPGFPKPNGGPCKLGLPHYPWFKGVLNLWTVQITPHDGFNHPDRWICITICFKVNGFWCSNSCSIKELLLLSLLVATNGTACVICSLDSTKSTIKLACRIRLWIQLYMYNLEFTYARDSAMESSMVNSMHCVVVLSLGCFILGILLYIWCPIQGTKR